MQPSITSRYECAGNSIGSIDAATSDDTEHGLTGIWMRRGQANARPNFPSSGGNNGQNFQCPPPLIAPHINF